MSSSTQLFGRTYDVPEATKSSFKITICGIGAVGTACAYALINQHIGSEIVLYDVLAEKLEGETMDFQHGAAYFHARVVASGPDFAETANSDVCIITSGVRQREGESRISLCGRNATVLQQIVPNIVRRSPNVLFLVVSNPCDVMTYLTWKYSGLPQERVIGSGTSLDSSRFRQFIAENLSIHPKSVHSYVIGEHGDTSVAVWSCANVGGVRLASLTDDKGQLLIESDKWKNIHSDVITAAYTVISKKGYTNWAIGVTVAHIVQAIRQNTKEIIPLSVSAKGFFGITEDVYLSLPSVIGRNGIEKIVTLPLDERETSALQASATKLAEIQNGLV